MDSKKIKKILNIVLSEPPAVTGMRINSIRNLAQLFGRNQNFICKILDEFVEIGNLSRRHGSGTFIKRLTVLKPYKDTELYSIAKEMTPDILCITPSGRKMGKHHLEICLWNDFLETTDNTHNLIAESIRKRAKELGHDIIMKSFINEDGSHRNPEEVIQEIRGTNYDGYIVVAYWAHLFNMASSISSVNENAPICFLMPCSYNIECDPCITLDADDITRRTIRIFADRGYKRVGILQIQGDSNSQFEDRCFVFTSEAERFKLQPFMQDVSFNGYDTHDVRVAIDHFITSKVEALYIADDHLLPFIAEIFKEKNIVPGEDIAIITLSNKGMSLPPEYNWSRFEFDLESFGKTIVDSLLNVISTAGENMMSFSHRATWMPGETHHLLLK